MDSAQWNQEFGVTSSIPCTPPRPVARPPKDQTLNCPRCHSTNTKFCYYNNYSLTQPRYLCKTCRRYWTAGGSLRNVPVGGGSRKHNKKYISTTPSDHHINSHPPVLPHHHQNPKIHDQGQDLNLGSGVPHFLKFPKIEGNDVIPSSSSSSTISSANATHLSAPNFMRSGNNFNVDRGPYNNSLVPTMVPISSGISSLDHHRQTNYALFPPPGFSFQECKPPLASFNVSGYTNSSEPEEDVNGTLMFTLGTTKRHSGTGEGGDHNHQDKGSLENNSNGFWNGVLGGGGSW